MASPRTVFFVYVPYCVLGLGALAMLIISFIWSIKSKEEVLKLREGFQSLVGSWDQDVVFDISKDQSFSRISGVENSYSTNWQAVWPGTVKGCYCTDGNSRNKVKKGLKDRICNQNETVLGCYNIEEIQRKNLTNWSGSQQIYAGRISGTSFYENYLKINSKGECSSGFKNCGDPSSISKGLCIPTSIPVCPLTDLSSSSQSGYSQVSYTGFDIYYASQANVNPISQLSIEQDHACFIRDHFPLSPGRSKYLLLLGDFGNCRKDEAAKYIGEMGETDFFSLNSIDHSKLTEYDSNNNFIYRLSFGKVLEWAPDCSEIVPSMRNKPTEINNIYSQYKILFILYILSVIIAGIYILMVFFIIWMKKFTETTEKLIKVGFVIRILGFILVIPSIIICTVKSNQFQNSFINIAKLGCSSTSGNKNFEFISADINSQILKKNTVMLSLSISGIAIESFLAYWYLKVMNLRSADK